MGIRLVLLFLFLRLSIQAEPNYLKACWALQGKQLASKYLTFAFQEKCTRFDTIRGNVMKNQYDGLGRIWCNASELVKKDTVQNNRRISTSTLYYNKSISSYKTNNNEQKTVNSLSINQDYISYHARYIPLQLLKYALKHHAKLEASTNDGFAIYTFSLNHTNIRIYIDKKSCLVHHIYMVNQTPGLPIQDQLISYLEYVNMGDIKVARSMRIEKWNGTVTDEIVLLRPQNINTIPDLK